ncbi:alpha/beta fold hydrolase [Microbacterium sp. zg.Y1090]|uniref:alpha/beta fold hydrolase n=1 Tax=Microbacterium TaxID=33882 RepID=UPI00214B2B74|nr:MULTISPECIES: alpha/beta fold hydrolase [unclassified Microbacterium]MCR2812927.1 alpha/beta fold hydrolase [Microbacterium sp. zg.Y1084]MCR2817264.1 alpha/beta fold hydrolase [Microbacterium sp. zg.Y1090]MDL5486068.1 alpha/beta fold hydrolase [Microbacterium sp. zg-Y1211]WIM29247.1 alpha/beta fold hydrolase [Microbacterium sp. zg-Y1090]
MSAALTGTLAGLPGLDVRCSRTREVVGRGTHAAHEWHYLDTGAELARLGIAPVGTILAVHGNPTWSYLWRRLVSASLRAAKEGQPAWRVIAVDQLDMGFSARTGAPRTLAQRVRDLGDVTDALGLEGPVVTLGHDWGGVVSLGWAIDHPQLLAGVIALNTAVHHPAGEPIPAPLRLAGTRGVLAASTVATPAFLETTLALAHPALEPEVKDAYRAPYRTAARREGIGAFVADIPVDAAHESFDELQRIADGVAALDVPALLLWGPADPIFGDRYLDDLVDRLPHADVHRFEGAGHLIAEDRPYADAILTWLGDNGARLTGDAGTASDGAAASPSVDDDRGADFTPLWAALDARRDDDVAVIDMATRRGGERRVSWRQLDDRVRRLAAGLAQMGVQKGQRVSVLVPPGPTLTAVIYACLRIGAVVVVADAGLGVRGLSRAVRGAWPDVVIGELPGLAAARALGWPGLRISVPRLPAASAKLLGVAADLTTVAAFGAGAPLPDEPAPDDPAAILFTSGSTGPAKGVAYTHRQLSALRDVLAAHFDVTGDTGLVTGFAPFALLGPALGTRSATPDMDVSAPRTLTARAVAAAVRASDARIVFLSPAAILNVVATAGALTGEDRRALATVRTFLSTGAPVGEPLLAAAAELMPNAEPHTPYGMTECLLVTDVTLDGIRAVADAADRGVCVGSPIGVNQVLISALDADGHATGAPSAEPGVLGEVVVSAPHLKTSYDRLWLTDRGAVVDTPSEGRWHRTGDVGHLDAEGRLWIEGRLPHVLATADGPVAPVGAEQDIEGSDGVRRAAVVAIGPHGLRQPVAVVETVPAVARPGLASPELTADLRRRTDLPLVAVLAVPQLPTDIRHNSKIDRTRLSQWAERTLAGGRMGRP